MNSREKTLKKNEKREKDRDSLAQTQEQEAIKRS